MGARAAAVSMVRRLYRWSLRRLYNELAWAYDPASWLVSAGRWSRWRRLALQYVVGTRVLEVGFGTGELLLEMARRGLDVCGLERSPAMQRIVDRKMRQFGVWRPRVCGLVQHLPFPAGRFDTVVSTFPAEFIVEPAVLREFGRVLRPPRPAAAAPGRLVVVGICVAISQPLAGRLAPFFYGDLADGFWAQLGDSMAVAGLRMRVIEHQDGWARVPVVIAERQGGDDG